MTMKIGHLPGSNNGGGYPKKTEPSHRDLMVLYCTAGGMRAWEIAYSLQLSADVVKTITKWWTNYLLPWRAFDRDRLELVKAAEECGYVYGWAKENVTEWEANELATAQWQTANAIALSCRMRELGYGAVEVTV